MIMPVENHQDQGAILIRFDRHRWAQILRAATTSTEASINLPLDSTSILHEGALAHKKILPLRRAN